MKTEQYNAMRRIITTLTACLLAASGCSKQTSTGQSPPTVIKVGAILPMTGTSADSAEHAKRGIDLAVKNLNASKRPEQPMLEVVYGDSKNMAKDGLTVFNKMVSVDRVKLFIATLSGVVVPLSETVGPRTDVLLLITISSAPGVTERGPNIFRLFVTAENEARTMSKFLFEKKRVSRVGVFYINDDFGLGGVKEFEKAFAKYGGSVAWKESWEKGGSDFRNSLIKVPKDVQALYIIGYEAGLGLAVKQARETGYDGVICTTVGMSVPPWRAAASEAANGVYYTSTGFSLTKPEAGAEGFIKAFKDTYGKDANSFAAFAYDSMMLLGKSIQETGDSPSAVAKAMTSAPAQQGVLGMIQFDADREADLPLRVWVFTNGKEEPTE